MKLGILTFHGAHNYGAVLQCYALQEVLTKMGHDVYVIDYRQPYINEVYKIFSFQILKRKMKNLGAVADYVRYNIFRASAIKKRREHFEEFTSKYLNLTLPCDAESVPVDFDAYIIGSDQVWSQVCTGGDFDDVYFGKFRRNEDSRVIGYAISSNPASVSHITSGKMSGRIGDFASISFREGHFCGALSQIVGGKAEVCVDPTLLSDSRLWDAIPDVEKKNPYVLVYEVGRQKDRQGLLRHKAERVAQQIGNNCKVLDVSGMNYSVEEFISFIRNADCVITSSFHGTVFSILFGRMFYCIKSGMPSDIRFVELLDSLGLEMRCVADDVDLQIAPVDYEMVYERLEDYRRGSLEFLKTSLK